MDYLLEKRASAQISIEQHSHFRWWCSKAWKQSLVWFWMDCNQILQPNWQQMKCYFWKLKIETWKPSSDHKLDECQFFIWRFFEQSATENIHLLVTHQPPITWSWRSVISSVCPVLDSILDLKVCKINYSLGNLDPILAKCLKSGQNLSRSGQKRYSCESGNVGSIPAGYWNVYWPKGHIAWHWACHCSDKHAFILLWTL